jgi:hypothetical protein
MKARGALAAAPLALAVATLCCGPRVDPPLFPPPPPPQNAVNATGDGQRVSGHIGPEGGSFELAADGLRLTLPAGTAGAEGLSLTLNRESNDGLPAAAARIGDAFRSAPALAAPSGKRLELRSVALSPLPNACQADGGATLALEAPPEAGPADGAHGPALSWQLQAARAEGDRVIAELPSLPTVRAVFLCGAEGSSQTAAREGSR